MEGEQSSPWTSLPFDVIRGVTHGPEHWRPPHVDHNSHGASLSSPAGSEEESYITTVKVLRLTSKAWRDGAGSAVTRLLLPAVASGPSARPLPTIFPELTHLDLSAVPELLDEHVPLFSGCRNLERLRLPAHRLTAEGRDACGGRKWLGSWGGSWGGAGRACFSCCLESNAS